MRTSLLVTGALTAGCGHDDHTTAGTPASALAAPAPHGAPGSPSSDSSSSRFDRSRIMGDSTSRVWFVIVSDFQCPYCKEWHDASFATLEREYVQTGKARMAFINFPLQQVHPNAMPAAEVAMCAGAQGKFWVMHEVLFNTQERWASRSPVMPVLDSLARENGVDVHALDACVSSHAPDALIQADFDRAVRAGVQSTPTVIIGKQLLGGVRPTDAYRHALDTALAGAK
jgi:protein-disulfide isomerase